MSTRFYERRLVWRFDGTWSPAMSRSWSISHASNGSQSIRWLPRKPDGSSPPSRDTGSRPSSLWRSPWVSGRVKALGLRWEDVDFAGGTLHVRNQLQRVDGRLVLVPP